MVLSISRWRNAKCDSIIFDPGGLQSHPASLILLPKRYSYRILRLHVVLLLDHDVDIDIDTMYLYRIVCRNQ